MSIANEFGSSQNTPTGSQEGGENNPDIGKTADAARHLGAEAKNYAAQKADELKGQATAALQQGKDRAQELYDQGLQQANELYEQGRARFQDIEQSLEEYVREKPVQSVLIAAGVGLALGLLLRR
jgi:ElaB/YqjD/DUF883 family membrane-anchored ribosome-binding protein